MSLTDEQAWQIVREAWDANGWMPMGHSEDEWPDSRYTSVVRAAYAAGERAMRERAARECESEMVDAVATGQREDRVYNSACEHCAAAVRALDV